MWGQGQRINRLEVDLASLSNSTSVLKEAVAAHIAYCTKDREAERDRRDQEHQDNQTSIKALSKKFDDAMDAQSTFTSRITYGTIVVLVTVLGYILSQMFHFKVTTGEIDVPAAMGTPVPPITLSIPPAIGDGNGIGNDRLAWSPSPRFPAQFPDGKETTSYDQV